jgi:hypothetical protein
MATTSNQTQNQSSTSTGQHYKPSDIKIPDGRRNSCGENMPSPVSTWKPNFARSQSWKMEDLKRKQVAEELFKKKERYEAMGGFTEDGGS